MTIHETRERAGMALLAVLLSAPAVAAASPDGWAWFRADSTGSAWWIEHGKADVTVSGQRFDATLRDSQEPTIVALSLRGSISNGLVRVRVTRYGTDAFDFNVSGRLSRVCWDRKGGRETLLLADGQGVLGLVRELDPSRACKPSGPRRQWVGP
jgi:hypothetical protein